MLKAFGKIRMKMMDEGNLKKYLLYGIGEILLVVIGILIAFQLDDWNSNRIEREQEKHHLISIQGDIQDDIANIENALAGNEILSSGIDTLLEMLAAPSLEKGQRRMLYLFSVKYTYWYLTVEFSELTLSQIKNSGSFQLIEDEAIAKAILQYDHGIEICKQEYSEQIVYYHQLENTQKKLFNLSLAKELFEFLTLDEMNMFAPMQKCSELTKEGDYFASTSPDMFNQYYGDVLYYQSQLSVIGAYLFEQKEMAESLSLLIDKKYPTRNG